MKKRIILSFALVFFSLGFGISSLGNDSDKKPSKEIESKLENSDSTNQVKKRPYRHRFRSSNLC